MFPSDTEKEHWKAIFRQFSSYVIVGGSGAIIEWCCFAGLVYFTKLSYLWSTVAAFVCELVFVANDADIRLDIIRVVLR